MQLQDYCLSRLWFGFRSTGHLSYYRPIRQSIDVPEEGQLLEVPCRGLAPANSPARATASLFTTPRPSSPMPGDPEHNSGDSVLLCCGSGCPKLPDHDY